MAAQRKGLQAVTAATKAAREDRAAKAAQVARDLAPPVEVVPGTDPEAAETVSFHLPLWMTDGLAELASLRLRRDKMLKRAARAKGEKPPQARRSASAIVREALEARWSEIEAETDALRAELAGRR